MISSSGRIVRSLTGTANEPPGQKMHHVVWLFLYLGAASAASLATPELPPSGSNDLSLSTVSRTVTVMWRRMDNAPNGAGYLLDVHRCTNLAGATNEQRCSSTVEITPRGSSFMPLSQCMTACGGSVCCMSVFALERGWWGRFRLEDALRLNSSFRGYLGLERVGPLPAQVRRS